MIITTPTHSWISTMMRECSEAFIVSSPYVGRYLPKAIEGLSEQVSVTLLTRTLIADFASKASDLEAVYQIAQRSRGILSLSSLHAKVYVVDSSCALVTSANATASGMYRNRECGVEVTSPLEISNLKKSILLGFGSSSKPKRWMPDDLLELRGPVAALRAALPKKLKAYDEGIDSPPVLNLRKNQYLELLESLPGWTRLTLEGIFGIEGETFTMEDVWNACAPIVAARFPNNQYPREKLRQQMQRLRDIGLVLFLEKGVYSRLTAR